MIDFRIADRSPYDEALAGVPEARRWDFTLAVSSKLQIRAAATGSRMINVVQLQTAVDAALLEVTP